MTNDFVGKLTDVIVIGESEKKFRDLVDTLDLKGNTTKFKNITQTFSISKVRIAQSVNFLTWFVRDPISSRPKVLNKNPAYFEHHNVYLSK